MKKGRQDRIAETLTLIHKFHRFHLIAETVMNERITGESED